MPQIVVLNWTLEALIRNQIPSAPQLDYIEVPPLPIQVVYEVSPLDFSTINNDPLLNQIMRDEYKDAIVKVVTQRILPRLKILDQQAGTSSFEDYASQRSDAHRAFDLDIGKGITDGDAAFFMRLQRLEMEKKEYKGYRLKVGKRVASFSVGVAGAAIGVAATVATSGAALPLAIVALYRAVMDGAKLFRDCWLEAEQCENNVVVGLSFLKVTYGNSKSLGRAVELGASVANAVLKIPVSTKLTNGSTIQSDCDLWKGKLTHLRYLAHELSSDLDDLLTKSTELSGMLGSEPGKKSYMRALKSVESDVNLLLTEGFYIASMKKRISIQDAHQRAEAGLRVHPDVEKALSAFMTERGEWVDKVDFAIGAIVDIGLMAASLGVGGAPSSALDIGSAVVGNIGNADATLNTLLDGAGQFETTATARDNLLARVKKRFKTKKKG